VHVQIIRITGSQRTAPFFIAKQEDSHEPPPRHRHLFQLQSMGAFACHATERLGFATAIALEQTQKSLLAKPLRSSLQKTSGKRNESNPTVLTL
jgi:hypothetical protein